MDNPIDDNRLKYEQTDKERIKELENKLIIEQTKINRLEHELTKAVDEKIDAEIKLERHHKLEATDYKNKYLNLKDRVKGLIYDSFISDGHDTTNSD
jgi:hypothetical protein